MKDTILFDLDGTLLPMDHDEFMRLYFEGLEKHFRGVYDYPLLQKTIWTGTKAMIQNDGRATNENVFWAFAERSMGLVKATAEAAFLDFYQNGFSIARGATLPNPLISRAIHALKQRGYTLVAATNPLFPRVASRNRLTWAGFDPDDFALITTYEDFHFCKPSLGYFREILQMIGKSPDACIMVGNDNQEDMCVEALGIPGYLITDCLINRGDAPITCAWQGSFADFAQAVDAGLIP